MKRIKTPLDKDTIKSLEVKEEILLSGKIITARDQAHKRLVELIIQGKKLPLVIKDQIVYYVGPTATPKGRVIGACGPTTSSRMDKMTIPLIKKGAVGFIGKGRRSHEVAQALKKNGAVYFIAPSGLGALLAKQVVAKKVLAFKELGPEAIYELGVKDFPLIVAIDSRGRDIYR